MAGYLPHYQKKIRIAAKRERELLHAIRHRFAQDAIVGAAELLRQAKLAAYRAKWAEKSSLPLDDYTDTVEAAKHKHVAKWLNASVETIIEWYTRKGE